MLLNTRGTGKPHIFGGSVGVLESFLEGVDGEVMKVVNCMEEKGKNHSGVVTTFNCWKVYPESVSKISVCVFQMKQYSKADQA